MDSQNKLVVEFIGTFFLVFTVGMAVASGSPLTPLAIGFSLMVMIFAGGHISGAHFNPAVSTAVWVRGKLTSSELIGYVGAQLAAAVVAALAIYVMGADGKDPAGVPNVGKALLGEFLFTFALAWVVLNVATSKGTDGNSFYGLAIGSTVTVGAVALTGISIGAFNPAVALGASIAGGSAWGDIWIYLVACLLGGAAAGVAFLATNPDEKAAA